MSPEITLYAFESCAFAQTLSIVGGSVATPVVAPVVAVTGVVQVVLVSLLVIPN